MTRASEDEISKTYEQNTAAISYAIIIYIIRKTDLWNWSANIPTLKNLV